MQINNFNSTIVRLKDSQTKQNKYNCHKFQFYDSTIKSIESIGSCLNSILKFQFYDSTIKRPTPKMWDYILHYFNSTIVRLKEIRKDEVLELLHNFNSTIVRLKEVESDKQQLTIKDFNSTIVRLKVYEFCTWIECQSVFQFYDSTIKSITHSNIANSFQVISILR